MFWNVWTAFWRQSRDPEYFAWKDGAGAGIIVSSCLMVGFASAGCDWKVVQASVGIPVQAARGDGKIDAVVRKTMPFATWSSRTIVPFATRDRRMSSWTVNSSDKGTANSAQGLPSQLRPPPEKRSSTKTSGTWNWRLSSKPAVAIAEGTSEQGRHTTRHGESEK